MSKSVSSSENKETDSRPFKGTFRFPPGQEVAGLSHDGGGGERETHDGEDFDKT